MLRQTLVVTGQAVSADGFGQGRVRPRKPDRACEEDYGKTDPHLNSIRLQTIARRSN